MKNRYLDAACKIRISTDISLPSYKENVFGGTGIHTLENKEKFRNSENVGRPVKYDVRKLDIGDSFLYDKDKYSFRGHECYWKLITGYKFAFRNTPEGNRVWRIN